MEAKDSGLYILTKNLPLLFRIVNFPEVVINSIESMKFTKIKFPNGLPSLKELKVANAGKDIPCETFWISGENDEVGLWACIQSSEN